MNASDTTQNTEITKDTLPAKKVSDSETHQLHVVIHPDINGFGRLFGGRLLEWIDEVAALVAIRHSEYRQKALWQRCHHGSHRQFVF